jgi:hypothetical protein
VKFPSVDRVSVGVTVVRPEGGPLSLSRPIVYYDGMAGATEHRV